MNKAEVFDYSTISIQNPHEDYFIPKRDWVEIHVTKGPMDIKYQNFSEYEYWLASKTLDPSQSNRQKIPGSRSENFLQITGWYNQKGPSCSVWALANGINLLGKEFNSDYIREAHEYALNNNKFDGGGISFGDLKNFMQYYPPMEITLQKSKKQLSNTNVLENAKEIKNLIDEGNIILISVNTSRYVNDRKARGHALCVAGYFADDYMDLQIVDPARGGIWFSLEHITSAINYGSTYIVSPSDTHL